MKKVIIIALSLFALFACKPAQQDPSYVVQVSLGSWHSPDYTAESIISRIDSVSALINVRKVIIGWSLEKDIYLKVGKHLHSKGIEMYLWMPVFAETEEMCENSPAVDLWGNIPANYDLAAGEGFRFNCPSDPHNISNVIDIYDRYFSDCGFDGAFLDRIRTQSVVGGINGILGCACPVCEELFKKEGVNLDDVRSAYQGEGDNFFSVSGYTPKDGFKFVNPVAESFFKAKGQIVSSAVAAVADGLKERGLKIGMDLFAPFMAPFVGQDYSILSAHTDFIKPMLYRKTDAPAGMEFEYELLRSAIPGASGYPDFKMDVSFLDSQLEAMTPYPCEKYPGIEINYRKDIVPTDPQYVVESLTEVMSYGFEGAVLSWNIMEAPDSHIACLGKLSR
ncbi:MAG: hypothetical protein II730_06875 [Bacteroidales bacterium]|nr:hypothetical protein [Bacteroidales bacterium]